jgi:hypothetical protein
VFHTRFLVLAAQEPDRVVRHGAAVFCHYIPETREIERESERERERVSERGRERASVLIGFLCVGSIASSMCISLVLIALLEET